jgi:hypothetical protein
MLSYSNTPSQRLCVGPCPAHILSETPRGHKSNILSLQVLRRPHIPLPVHIRHDLTRYMVKAKKMTASTPPKRRPPIAWRQLPTVLLESWSSALAGVARGTSEAVCVARKALTLASGWGGRPGKAATWIVGVVDSRNRTFVTISGAGAAEAPQKGCVARIIVSYDGSKKGRNKDKEWNKAIPRFRSRRAQAPAQRGRM